MIKRVLLAAAFALGLVSAPPSYETLLNHATFLMSHDAATGEAFNGGDVDTQAVGMAEQKK
jgi:hypothetical protein